MSNENRNLINDLENKIRAQQQEIELLTEKYNSAVNAYKQLEKAFCLSPGHLYWKDKDGVYKACNNQQAITLGYKEGKDIVGKTDFDLPWGDKGKFLKQIDTHVMQTQFEYVVEEALMTAKGDEAIFLSRKVPMYDDEGNVSGIIGISFDISKEKEVEALKIENEVSKEVIERLKTISGSLSHEIRTPLAGVRVGLQTLKPFFVQLIDELMQSDNMDLIDNLREKQAFIDKLIGRIDEGNALITLQLKNMTLEQVDSTQFKPCKMKETVLDAINTFPFKYKHEKALLNTDVGNDFSFWGEPILTKHIIWNLLSNALHFIGEEGKGEVYITTEKQTDYNVIRIKDTAKGMSKEETEKVFKRYYTNRKGGSGLGLSFCQLMMQAYQGDIECQAEEGEYTEFLLFFPKEFKLKNTQISQADQECLY